MRSNKLEKVLQFNWKVILLVGFILTSEPLAAQGIFQLKSSHQNADINYLTLKNINSLTHGYQAMLKAFQPVKGQYQVYLFIKESEGSTKYGKEITFHDLIILKTDRYRKIVDGFYYRLEWEEIPSQSGIFRIGAVDIKLVNNLKVADLEFYNEYDRWGKALDDIVRLQWCDLDVIHL